MSSKPAIRIEAIPVHELEAFANRAKNETGIVPITPRRSRAHAANPNAVPDDVALLVAYDGDRCVGYLGIMAGVLSIGGEPLRMHWFSSWYVDPAEANSGAATMLLMRAIGLKYDLAVTGTSRDADEMFRAMRFKEIGPLKYEEVFLDALDPLGFPFFAVGKWLEKRNRPSAIPYAIARVLRPVAQPVLKRLAYTFMRPATNGATECRISDTFERHSLSGATPRFYRDAETVNWMLEHPWFTEDRSDAVNGYYFGDHRPIFRYTILRLERHGGVIGNAVLSISRKSNRTTVKVLDYWFNGEEDRSALVAHIFDVASRYRADRILFPGSFKNELRRLPFFGRITITRTRNYFCRPKKKDSVLTPVLDEIELQFTDGDCAFS